MGFVCNQSGRRMGIDKIRGWAEPSSKTELRSFLGFCRVYGMFVKDYSKKISKLVKLTGKKDWVWGKEEKEDFEALKEAMISSPVLCELDMKSSECGEIVLSVDCSEDAIGCVLEQKKKDGMHPVRFDSRVLTEIESSYGCLASYFALKKWKHFLYGRRFVVKIDDKDVCMMVKERETGDEKIMSWLGFICSFDFELRFVGETKKIVAEALSKSSVHMMEVKKFKEIEEFLKGKKVNVSEEVV